MKQQNIPYPFYLFSAGCVTSGSQRAHPLPRALQPLLSHAGITTAIAASPRKGFVENVQQQREITLLQESHLAAITLTLALSFSCAIFTSSLPPEAAEYMQDKIFCNGLRSHSLPWRLHMADISLNKLPDTTGLYNPAAREHCSLRHLSGQYIPRAEWVTVIFFSQLATQSSKQVS